MVLSLVVPLVLKFLKLDLEYQVNPQWTEEELDMFLHFWLVIISM